MDTVIFIVIGWVVGFLAWFIGVIGFCQIIGSIRERKNQPFKLTFITIFIWIIILTFITFLVYRFINKYFLFYIIGIVLSLLRVITLKEIK